MTDQLQRLRSQAATVTRPTAASPAADMRPNPQATPRPSGRPVVPSPPRPAVEPVAEDYGDAFEADKARGGRPADRRQAPPRVGPQPTRRRQGWLVGLGKRMRYPNRILDWSPKQVQTAYKTYRQAHSG